MFRLMTFVVWLAAFGTGCAGADGPCRTVTVPQEGLTTGAPAEPASEPVAEAPTLAPSVVKESAAAVVVAPSGKAWAAPYVRGNNAYIGRLELAAGAAVPEHQDPTEETIIILEGGGTLTIDGTAYDVVPGDVIFMPAGVTVSYQNGDTKLVALQVFAGPGPAAKYDGWSAQ